jgi:hypothetical protein
MVDSEMPSGIYSEEVGHKTAQRGQSLAAPRDYHYQHPAYGLVRIPSLALS